MENLIITETSKNIASTIKSEMQKQHITPTKLDKMLEGKCNMYTIRRIRQGHSGAMLRSYEDILSALGLRFAIVPKKHKDVID